jgi:quinol monooxygenase YgiN
MQMSNIGVVAKIVAQPGKEDVALQELRRMVAPTRKENGCIKYVLHRSKQNPSEFWFVEEWTSVDALDKHKQTPHYLHLIQQKANFAASGDVIVLEPIADND